MKKFILLLTLISSISFAKDIVVMSIDTGVDLSHKFINDHVVNVPDLISYDDYNDVDSHGTHVAGIILKDVCPQVKFISCKYYYKSWERLKKDSSYCFMVANLLHVDFINFSSGGKDPIEEEQQLLEVLTANGTKVIVSAGNNGQEKPNYYPANYNIPGVTVVGNLREDGTRNPSSNYGFKDMVWEIGTNILSTIPGGKWEEKSGTSMAAAVHTNKLLREKCLKSE